MNKKLMLFIFTLIIISCKKEIKKNEKVVAPVVQKIIKDTLYKIATPKYNFDKSFILGKFNYKKDTNFIHVKAIHSNKTLYLHKEVYNAFQKMYLEAKKEDINLKIVSGTRSFYEQKYIWENKWKKYKSIKPLDRALKILEYSSMPSTSRHHWGTDIDLNNLNNSYFENGKGKKEYNWLVNHANNFGFYQVYTNKENGRTGYNLEKWHWSYLPLAKGYLNYYKNNIIYKDIKDFKGSELAKDIKIITRYVNGISEKAK